MPRNFEAEQALLGALLVNNQALERVADFLLPKHFADPLHGRLYECMSGLILRGVVANPTMIMGFMTDAEFVSDSKGAPGYLARLAVAAIGAIDAADYGRQIVDLYERRMVIDAGNEIIRAAHDERGKPATEIIADAEAMLFAAAERGHASDRLVDAHDSVEGALMAADAAMRDRALPEAERQARRIVTGLAELDQKLRIERGDVVYIAGATSSGKSALADNIAEANEARGMATGIFAMEMSSNQWWNRRFARHAGISSTRIRDGDISQREYEKLGAAARILKDRPMLIDDTPALSVAQIRSRLRRMVRRHGVSLGIVDYLQLMQPDEGRRSGTRAEELGQMTRALKAMAQELNIGLIVLSQINRGVNTRDDKRPDLGDLRESGSIEQDANAVLFVYREEYYLSRNKATGRGGKAPSLADEMDHMARLDAAKGRAEIIIAKQRDGEAPVTVHCRWDGIRTRFSDGGAS